MTVQSLRTDASALPATFPAVKRETQHADESLRLIGEVVLLQTASDEHELDHLNSSVNQMLDAALVEATLAQAAATGRLADATERLITVTSAGNNARAML